MVRRRRAPPSTRQQILGLLGLLVFSALGIGGAVLATRHFGAEPGEACVQGIFSCREVHGFNTERCLHETEEAGYCTFTCSSDADCPAPLRCEYAQWGDDGRVEAVCLRVGGTAP